MDELDRDLELLQQRKDAWARLPVGTKIEYLLSIRANTLKHAEGWVNASVAAKSIPANSPLAGEEWISGPWALLYALNRYVATLTQIKRFGSPQLPPGSVRERHDGQVVVDVFPNSIYDRVLLSGVSAEVWMQPGVTPENLQPTLGVFYQKTLPEGTVALVLGAGNISSIAPLDVLCKLLADGSVCLLKLNPVNAYLGPIFESVFAPLVVGGYLRIAYGGADIGAYLTAHKLVDEIHITGSDKTHDAIVQSLPTAKPITSELGNVSPTIVVPGDWSSRDFDFQAQNIVTQKMHNGGFNCIAAQVLVLPRDWDGTPKLLAAIDAVMKRTQPRIAYYPGAADRWGTLVSAHPDAQTFDTEVDGAAPRTLLHADPDAQDPLFANEAFCATLGVVQLPGDASAFLNGA
ncbi:MAG: aldehyde dehydrogenase family protein, partial [Candidatus Eremiobacteraeota bacterium]|nr:aldehyde dehydrogenase family protein [Candidatus Eremiobacteraeota bacterium]